jgi:hypothetical protein
VHLAPFPKCSASGSQFPFSEHRLSGDFSVRMCFPYNKSSSIQRMKDFSHCVVSCPCTFTHTSPPYLSTSILEGNSYFGLTKSTVLLLLSDRLSDYQTACVALGTVIYKTCRKTIMGHGARGADLHESDIAVNNAATRLSFGKIIW